MKWFVFFGTLVALSYPSAAQEKGFYKFPIDTSRLEVFDYNQKEITPLPSRAQQLLAQQKRRFPNADPVNIFYHEGRDYDFLAISWHLINDRTEFFRIPKNSMRMTLLTPEIYTGRIGVLSGKPVFKDGPPVLILSVGGCGSAVECYRLHLYDLEGRGNDIVPASLGRVVDVVDLDKDGFYEVVTMLDEWAIYDSRGAAGPHIPVVLTWEKGRFIPVCRNFKNLYQQEEAQLTKALATEEYYGYRFEYLTGLVLIAMQMGEKPAAEKYYAQLVSEIRSYGQERYLPDISENIGKPLADWNFIEAAPCGLLPNH